MQRSGEASAPAELDAPSVGARRGGHQVAQADERTGQMQARQDGSCLAVAAGRRRTQASLVVFRKLERLDENIGAVAVKLASDDLREIDSVASQITVQGARYPEELERMTGR
jgi:aryl-alcohol dehydrogenase-like predicted oxidoreductase